MRVPPSAIKLLRKIHESEDQEIVRERGAGWWVGCHQVSGRTARTLLQMCLLRADSLNSDSFERFTLSREVEKILKDSEHKLPDQNAAVLKELLIR